MNATVTTILNNFSQSSISFPETSSGLAANFTDLQVFTTDDLTTSYPELSTAGGSLFLEEEDDEEDQPYSLAVQIIAGVIIVVCAFVNIVGNTCTLIAFCQDPKLRTPYNCYIANLAVTDLAVGCISVPFYAVYTIRRYYWQFGYLFCKVWCVVDFLVCAESALTIALVSHDRFLLVRDGALYNTKHTRQKALAKIGVSWLFAFLLYGPAVIGFDRWRGYSTVEEDDCDVEFATDFWYTLITAIIEFLVPAVLLVVFNVYIFWKIRQRALAKVRKENMKGVFNRGFSDEGSNGKARKEVERTKDEFSVDSGLGDNSSEGKSPKVQLRVSAGDSNMEQDGHPGKSTEDCRTNVDLVNVQLEDVKCKIENQVAGCQRETSFGHAEYLSENGCGVEQPVEVGNVPVDVSLASLPNVKCAPDGNIPKDTRSNENMPKDANPQAGKLPKDSQPAAGKLPKDSPQAAGKLPKDLQPAAAGKLPPAAGQMPTVADKNMKRYRKAARSLAMLVAAFSICWLPYTISTLVLSFCETCVNQDLYEAFNWLLWLNSSINPILYAAMNPLFRRHYRRLLCQWRFCEIQKDESKSLNGSGSAIEPSSGNTKN